MTSELTRELIELAAREEALMERIRERVIARKNRQRVTERTRDGDDE